MHRERAGRCRARACTMPWRALPRRSCPMELASTRLAMARSLAESSPEVAIAEAKSALEGFERLEAARHADAAAQMLRSLGAPARTGPKGVGALTKREAEVLKLVGAGLSNPEIADRLYITRKTVEHHVGERPGEAGVAEPGRGGRLRGPGENPPVDRGPPRCSHAGDLSSCGRPCNGSTPGRRDPPPTHDSPRGRRTTCARTATTSSWWGRAAPGPRPRCCSPARATGCSSSTGRRSRATRSRPTSSTRRGWRRMQRWGLLDRLVATGCPPIDTYTFDFGPFTLSGAPGTEAAPVAYCPRRTVLDKLLVDAASEAGAEVREAFTVQEIVVEDDRVVGIRGRGKDGATVTERAERGHRRGRTELVRRQGGSARAVQREAAAAQWLLHATGAACRWTAASRSTSGPIAGSRPLPPTTT